MNKKLAIATLALSSATLSTTSMAQGSGLQAFNLDDLSFSTSGEVLVNGQNADTLMTVAQYDVIHREGKVKNKKCPNQVTNYCSAK